MRTKMTTRNTTQRQVAKARDWAADTTAKLNAGLISAAEHEAELIRFYKILTSTYCGARSVNHAAVAAALGL